MKAEFGNTRKIQAASFFLRYQVFVLEQQIDPALEFDALDTGERNYYLLFDEFIPVATVRYQKIDEKTLQPDRLCVAKNYRQQGYGAEALSFIEAKARKEGCQQSILSAEISAEEFYLHLGYQVSSKPFYEDGILCQKMQKKL